jgi:predicted histone-like DNA-binding protein
MKYKLVRRKNPRYPQAEAKLYAIPVNEGKVTQQEVAVDIVNLSSLSRGDVGNVINSLIDTVPKYLLMGRSVNLGELGTFRISFSSKGVDEPGDFTVDKISAARIVFTPSVELKRKLDHIHFEKSE